MEIMKTWTAPSPEGENITYEIYDEQARNDIATLKNDVANKEASGTAETKVSNHNTDTKAHNDIRLLLTELITQVNSFLDVDDTTRDQLSEILRDIDANKTSIESITSGKVNVTDIINNLTTNVANKPLSAAQGVVLKGLIDTLQTAVNNHTSNGNIHITAEERAAWNAKQPAGSYALQSEVDSLSEEIVDQNSRIEQAIENEKGSIVQLLIDELQGLPVFGVVDENNDITLITLLPNGTGKLKFEYEDGTTEQIGTYTITDGAAVWVNILPTALTPNDITAVFDGVGYKNGYYASAASPYYNTDSAFFCSGLMPIPAGKTFYISGCTIDTSLSHTRFGLMREDGGLINTAVIGSWNSTFTVKELGTQYYSITIDTSNSTLGGAVPYYFYFSASGTGDNVIVSHTPIE